MEEHHVQYMKLNYPNEPNREMTPYDVKSANIIHKIKNKYANYIQSKRHTILLEKGPLIEIKPNVKSQPKEPKPVPKPQPAVAAAAVAVAVAADAMVCKAIVIRTNAQCGRKLKSGCEFCGFHSKK